MRIGNLRYFLRMHHLLPYGTQQSSNTDCTRAHCVYHMNEVTRTLWFTCIFRNSYYLWMGLSGWKGSFSYGLGTDISLPPCLETGIWSLAHKSDHRAEISGASFGTTLWHRPPRYRSIGILFAHAQSPRIVVLTIFQGKYIYAEWVK